MICEVCVSLGYNSTEEIIWIKILYSTDIVVVLLWPIFQLLLYSCGPAGPMTDMFMLEGCRIDVIRPLRHTKTGFHQGIYLIHMGVLSKCQNPHAYPQQISLETCQCISCC